jgi:hypothetical protein
MGLLRKQPGVARFSTSFFFGSCIKTVCLSKLKHNPGDAINKPTFPKKIMVYILQYHLWSVLTSWVHRTSVPLCTGLIIFYIKDIFTESFFIYSKPDTVFVTPTF